MPAKKKPSVSIPIKMNPEELAIANWLAKKTKRARGNAIKWATAEKAEELGYKPKKMDE